MADSSDVPVLGLRAKKAAKAIGISERKLWSITKGGEGPPHVKIGDATVYPVAQLEQWLAEQAKSSEK